MTTYHDRLVAGLLALGYKPAPTMSRYDAFAHPEYNGLLFVGPFGALRRGHVASKSHSVGDPSNQTPFYKTVLAASEPKPLVLE